MSYARFGWDGSDVYVFLGSEKLECCACHIMPTVKFDPPRENFFGMKISEESQSFYAETPADMIEHLKEHIKSGDTVPEETIEDIKRDFPNLTKPIPKDFNY